MLYCTVISSFSSPIIFEGIFPLTYAVLLTSKSPRSVVWKYCKASLKEMRGVGLESSVRAGVTLSRVSHSCLAFSNSKLSPVDTDKAEVRKQTKLTSTVTE